MNLTSIIKQQNDSSDPSLLDRRRFLATGALTAAAVGSLALSNTSVFAAESAPQKRIYKSLKFGMFREKISTLEKFKILRDVGFDGVELDAPHGQNKQECLEAALETGLMIDGMVNDVHWRIRMSDPDAAVRQQSTDHMLEAIQQCWQCHGNTVLLVPGHGKDGSQQEVAERSIAEIKKCLPLCSRLGIYIAIENVWNEFLYEHDGPANQTAERLADYVDQVNSPWVGVQFDIGNHQKYGPPAGWVRTLGRRIVKLDVKDWGTSNGFCKIGDGDVDWDAVCQALDDIKYTGWAAAEVAGGDRQRMADVSQRMDNVLGLG